MFKSKQASALTKHNGHFHVLWILSVEERWLGKENFMKIISLFRCLIKDY